MSTHKKYSFARFACLSVLFVALSACGGKEQPQPAPPAIPPSSPATANEPAPKALPEETPPAPMPPQPAPPLTQKQLLQKVPAGWRSLAEKLFADGYGSPSLVSWFIAIGDSYSDNPMGVKLKELFKIKYMPSPPRPAGSPPPPRIYSSFANKETVEKCRAFLAVNERSFDLEEERFGVPREIIAALLMVETKLGGYLGKNNPFWSLSCMAAADSPNMVPAPLAALPVQPEHMPWVEETLKARSSWAYKELGSLIRYCADNSVNPVDMKGSVYGAIGLCQFMPSNITRFGVDGNNDGKIDLFSVEDAIHSVGSYFRQNGWKPGLSHEERVTVIKRYNKSNPYANTILYLASEITLANAMGEQSGK